MSTEQEREINKIVRERVAEEIEERMALLDLSDEDLCDSLQTSSTLLVDDVDLDEETCAIISREIEEAIRRIRRKSE